MCLSLIGGKTGKKRGNPSFVAGGVGMVTGRQTPFSGAQNPCNQPDPTERKSEIFNWSGRIKLV